MSERLEAAKYLRRHAKSLEVPPHDGSTLEAIAELVESHDERVTDLLIYNNTMLDENRAQRREIERLKARIETLCGVIYGEGQSIEPLTKDEHETLIKAVRESHDLLQVMDDGDHYQNSDVRRLNIDALELA